MEPLREPLMKEDTEWTGLPTRKQKWPREYTLSVLVHILTICLLPVIYFVGYQRGLQILPKLPTHSVSNRGYHLGLQVLDDEFDVQNMDNKKYKGVPRPELDDAWERLLQHMNIRVHPEEAKTSGFESVELNDGSGDLAALPTVFHSLHCLKALRRSLFPESYPQDWKMYKPPYPGGINPHVDHCLENLRQAVMCQGDVSLYRYMWLPTADIPRPLAHMSHMCVDWNKLMGWASERSFSIHDGLLTNPDRGTWIPDAGKR